MAAAPDLLEILVTFTLGGAGAKALDFLLSRGRAKFDLSAALRSELRADLDRARAHVLEKEKEIEDIRKECDTLRDRNFAMQGSAHTATMQLADLAEKCADLTSEIDKLKRGVRRDSDG